MRDRLIDLLKKADKNASMKCITDYEDAIADNADYLLEHGVIVLPCIAQHGGAHIKLGVNYEGKVIAESVFFSKEEAEQALRKEDEGK